MFHLIYYSSSLFINLITLCFIFYPVKQVQCVQNPIISASSFCYEDPTCGPITWSGECNIGTQQSPIDIKLKPFQPYFAPPTKFYLNNQYANEVIMPFYGQNTGHSVQFDVNPNAADVSSELEISGGKLNGTYKFAQLHFHWAQENSHGSEHTVNGKSYVMEMHLVHHKSIYPSFTDAVMSTNDREAVAVFAVFFKLSLIPNIALIPLVQALKKLREPGDILLFDASLRIRDFYPKQLEFVRYLGSLTTPTCDEKVIWTVFMRPLHISQSQLNEFRKLKNEELVSTFNFRETQPINGRTIQIYRGKYVNITNTSILTIIINYAFNVVNYLYNLSFAILNTKIILI